MDFFRLIGAKLNERFQRHNPQGRFVPVKEIKRSSQVPQAAADIVDTLRVDDEAARVLRHALGEVVDNVFVHAESPVNAYVCAQHFPKGRYTQVGIVDTGIGFRATFANSPNFSTMRLSHREAISLGVAPFVTSKPYAHTVPYGTALRRLGIGLFIVCETLVSIGGRVIIASGNSVLGRGNRTRWVKVDRSWQGAIVGLQVPDDPVFSFQDALRRARERADIARAENEA